MLFVGISCRTPWSLLSVDHASFYKKLGKFHAPPDYQETPLMLCQNIFIVSRELADEEQALKQSEGHDEPPTIYTDGPDV